MSTGTSSVLVLYYVDDCNFYLSDDNCNRTLDYFGWSQYSADTKENMGIADLYNGLYCLYNNDCLTVSEHQSKVFSHTIADKMKFMETYFDNILFQIRVSESIVVDDIASRIMYWEMSKDETVSVSDDYVKVFESVRVFSETISHADSVIRSSDVVISDDIQFVDTVSRDVSHVLYDCFTVDESLNSSVDYVRLVDEMASIGDTIQNYTGKNVYVLLSLYDSYVRASNAIIESIIASNTALSTSDFTSILNKNPVYEEFSDFNVGDYEYENAMVRLKIISNATHSQPLVYDVSAHVDIDDTNDKGQTEITDTAKTTKIHYNKHYYNAPEVQVTLCGGTGTGTITPHIVTTDGNDDNGRYFEIALYDTSGNMTAGTISWVAKGW